MTLRLEASQKNLEREIAWVGNADNKALIVLALQGAVIAGIATIGPAIRRTIEHQAKHSLHLTLYVLFGGFVFCFLSALGFALYALAPRTTSTEQKTGRKSPFYFGSIARMSLCEFRDEMRALDAEAIEEHLVRQTHINATIVTRKFQALHRAIRCLGAEFIFLFIAVMILLFAPVR